MRICLTVLFLAFAGGFATGAERIGADTAELTWSAFKTLDMKQLAAGEVVTESKSSMKFARGMSAEATYVVAAPMEAVAKHILTADPTKHSELEVYQYRAFRDEREARFEEIKLHPEISSFRHTLRNMRNRQGLQWTADEKARLPASGAVSKAEQYWADLLRQRWRAFSTNGALGGALEYKIASELKSLLAEEPGMAAHFSALLAVLYESGSPVSPATNYWDVSLVDGNATAELGALFQRTTRDRVQILDATYYASSGYLASLALHELAPVKIGGKPCTLVWEGVLVSSTELTGAFGLKRSIAARLVQEDLKRGARIVQSDAPAGR